MKQTLKLAALAALVCLLLSVLTFAGYSQGIRDRVVRLHVPAHDNSPAQQALKLKVRDAVSEETANLLNGITDRAAVLACLRENLSTLQTVAEQCIKNEGYSLPVTAELTTDYFTTREYDAGTYPAGVYDTLRITIGDGAGRNWWCVLYPPLCVSAATKAPTAEDVLTSGQCTVLATPRYAVRFKLVEWWESLRKQK